MMISVLFWGGLCFCLSHLFFSLFQKDIFTADDVYRTVDQAIYSASFQDILSFIVPVEKLSHVILSRL